ncbi:MAG: hypothetical protein KJ566_02130, partial [Nanoarchaeota archaeon]|nr:hypothetical protein [Nanoarchaeota archaeon]
MNGKLIFNDNDFTVILNVNKDLFDFEKVREFAQKENLFEKFEMHLTIVGRKIGEEIQLNFSNFWGEIKNIIKNMDWDFLIEKSFYFITKKYEEYGGEIRKSIIQIVKFPCLKEFYKKIKWIV